MASSPSSSSDDETTHPTTISDYEFLTTDNSTISFSELPSHFSPSQQLTETIFLKGKIDNGLRLLYTEVKSWRFDISCTKPDIEVFTIDGKWIKLFKPRKAYEVVVRTLLVTVHCLHFVKFNSGVSSRTLWDQLAKRFRFERKPCQGDLVEHFGLIEEAVKRDETLAKSKILTTFLKEKPSKKRAVIEGANPSFIVDDGSESEEKEPEDSSDDDEVEVDDCFDSVCAICDNGGHIYLCEGKCMRSFHATEEDGEDSLCGSLGFTKEEVEAIKNVDFYCKNCEYKQHQCFSCGELGSSDESSGCAEVFRCINGACGRFYHPGCVAQLLHPKDKGEAEEYRQKIGAGEQFACPAHKCHVCGELEVKSDHDLQFAVCRRCPRAYHRKCLPREIASEEDVEEGRATIQRAWEGLIPKRILIYCLNHEIDETFLTPARNHIKFPGPAKKKRKLLVESSQMDLAKDSTNSGKRNDSKRLKVVHKVVSSGPKKGDISRTRVENFGISKQRKVDVKRNLNESTRAEDKISLGDRLYRDVFGLDSEPAKASRVRVEDDKTQKRMPATKRINSTFTLDDDAKKRILDLMKDASSFVSLEEIKKRHKAPSTHAYSLKHAVENVTLGKVEGSVQALRTALEKLDKGGSVRDAQAVCGNDLLLQVIKWKERLGVHLSPFLYGTRYTSFGRHFTKSEKLKEIVDMLHCYIQDGDTLVDFCCGSNEFSCLTKNKVDEVGKNCSFKNYDIVQAKNDFCFETRDWMKVKPHELPKGSQLIMGLNPPFGVNAALANKFIDHALEFSPKLLILIVPRETKRLDEKKKQYELIWEDDQMLSGKSFYIPGSVDVNYKQIEDWNVTAPVLYLWSRPDWTRKHKAIAQQHSHPGPRSKCKSEEIHSTMLPPSQSQNKSNLNNKPQTQNQVEDKQPPVRKAEESLVKEQSSMKVLTRHQEEGSCDTKGDNHNNSSVHVQSNNRSEPMKGSSEVKGKEKKNRRFEMEAMQGKSPVRRPAPSSSPVKRSAPSSSPVKRTAPNTSPKVSSSEAYSSKHFERQSSHVHPLRDRSVSHDRAPRIEKRIDDYHHQQVPHHNRSPYQSYPQAASGENQVEDDDLVMRYSLMGGDSFPSMASIYDMRHSPNHDSGFRASTERYIGYPAERTGPATLPPYSNRSYDQNYGNEIIYQSQVSIQGGPDPWGQRADYLSPHSQMTQVPRTVSYGGLSNSTSAMQRYAPRLDGSNPGPPTVDSYHNPGGPRPGGSQGGSLGFSPGPDRAPYSHHRSFGWVDE